MASKNEDPSANPIQNFLTTNKGVQRLSWVAGTVVGVLTALLTAPHLNWHDDVSPTALLFMTTVGFAATWLLVRAGAWVVEGFKTSGKGDSPPSPQEETDSEK